MTHDSTRTWLGIALLAASAAISSTAGFFSRAVAVDAFTMVFWRCLFGGLLIAGYLLWRHSGATLAAIRAVGFEGLMAASCSAIATICFINALTRTTVAAVTVIFAAAPFVAAALAWLWYRERPGGVTLAASTLALLGVVLTVDAAVAAGTIIGDLLALAMTILMATYMVIVRRRRDVSMLPASCLSAFLAMALVAPVARPFAPSGTDLAVLAGFGAQFGLTLLLLTLGARLIAAPRAALLGSLEIPLAPLWVLLAFAEVPGLMVAIGGALVLAAVIADALFSRGSGEGPGQQAPEPVGESAGVARTVAVEDARLVEQ
ncbi:MAG: EamA family transporter [Alphaproteobacteria bacterium]|nr:EamA family transporter [Alphaproteobacteria bacterium]